MQSEGYTPNTAQRLLAEEVTRFVHGQQGLDDALKATQVCCPVLFAALQSVLPCSLWGVCVGLWHNEACQ